MRTMEQLIANIHLFLALATLGLLWFRWRTYRIDAVRQQLFALRDEAFDYACDGGIAFEHQAYKLLRTKLNGMIRFAHRVSFGRLFLSLVFFHSTRPDFVVRVNKEWEAALGTLSLESRKKLLEFDQKMVIILVQHMVTRSPILLLVLGIFVALAVVSAAVTRLWEIISKLMPGMDLLEAQALQAQGPISFKQA